MAGLGEKRHELDGYQGQILAAAALTLHKMGWERQEIHQMVEMAFEVSDSAEELIGRLGFRPRSCPDCHSIGYPKDGCQNLWHVEVRP
jgi:hypothetical protein